MGMKVMGGRSDRVFLGELDRTPNGQEFPWGDRASGKGDLLNDQGFQMHLDLSIRSPVVSPVGEIGCETYFYLTGNNAGSPNVSTCMALFCILSYQA
jgi:hypothetical protein